MSALVPGSSLARSPLPALQATPQKRVVVALRGLAGFLRGMAKAIANRREIARLGELDDRMLKDIGLVRGDVIGALSEPIHHDPSIVLVVRSVERRAAGVERARSSLRRAMVTQPQDAEPVRVQALSTR